MDDPFAPAAFFPFARERLDPSPPPAERARPINPERPMPRIALRDAAVLIPIVARETASVLLTRRTLTLRKHAGQIAFPGGAIDPTDRDAADAAKREAFEEVGLSPDKIETIGFLDPYLVGTGYRITPVVAKVDPDHALVLNPAEVDAAFEVPLAFLMTEANHRRGTREFEGVRYHFYEMPYDDHYIWGVTAGIVRGLYERLYRGS